MRNKSKLYRAISLISFIIMLLALAAIAALLISYKQSRDHYAQLSETAWTATVGAGEDEALPADGAAQGDELAQQGSAAENEQVPEPVEIPINFDYLLGENEDIIGWITVDGTEIDYPILYDTTYNRYYLTHNYAGTATPYGSIFILGENAGDYSDFNTVVYGHNMIDGHMFAQLHRFKEQTFFDTHDQIVIYTPDRKLTYQVFAAYRSNNLDIIANNDFSTQELREQYIKSIYTNVELGLFDRDIPVTGEDRIITLSTCIWNPAYRFLVQGVLVSDEPGAFTGTQMTSENAYG